MIYLVLIKESKIKSQICILVVCDQFTLFVVTWRLALGLNLLAKSGLTQINQLVCPRTFSTKSSMKWRHCLL